MTILLFVAGLILLIGGAEVLVRGASRLAGAFGVSPLVIGLTVVAFGTSSPELAVSVKSTLSGQGSIALGNVIGSNIFNVLFILGLAALIMPLTVAQQLIKLDVPLMIGLSVAVLLFALDRSLSRVEGVILIAALVAYIAFSIYKTRSERAEVEQEYQNEFGPEKKQPSGWFKNIAFVLAGLALLVLGSRWLVASAVSFAQAMGVSELIVGLTIIAAGTSLPEVVTSAIAAFRGERDIAVGNVVGSNIFNLLAVLGFASAVAPAGIPVSEGVIRFDLPVMIAVAAACLPIFFTGGVINRFEAVLLLGYYIAYTAYLILSASEHDALPAFSSAMLYFVLPLTTAVIIIIVVQQFRRRRPPPASAP